MEINYIKKVFGEEANFAIMERCFFYQYYLSNFIEQKDEELRLTIILQNDTLITTTRNIATEKRVKIFKDLLDQVNNKRW